MVGKSEKDLLQVLETASSISLGSFSIHSSNGVTEESPVRFQLRIVGSALKTRESTYSSTRKVNILYQEVSFWVSRL